MDIIDRIDELIVEAEKEPTWTAVQALRCLRKELQKENRSECDNCTPEYWDECQLCKAR